MPTVEISIHGRLFPIACDEGEEERVGALGAMIDRRFRELAGKSPPTSEARLMVLTALTFVDELMDLKESKASETGSAETAARGLDHLAERLESLGGRIESG